MKKINILILVLLLGNALNINGQEKQKLESKKNSIVFSPLCLLDPINPALQLGYQRMIGLKWELQLEGGYIINKSPLILFFNPGESSDEYTNKGYKVRTELKYIIIKKRKFNFYSSCEIQYLKNKSEVVNQFIVSDPTYDYSFDLPSDAKENEYEYNDYFTNNKTKYALNIKGGIKLFAGSMLFEGSSGLGIAYRKNIHSNRENLNDAPLDDSFLNDNLKGEKIILNIPLNIKIGYRF
jgi:hypothetical protein